MNEYAQETVRGIFVSDQKLKDTVSSLSHEENRVHNRMNDEIQCKRGEPHNSTGIE